MTGIYKIENIIDHKVYIGKSKNIKKRFCEHKRSLSLNEHINPYLQHAVNKYGIENFDFAIIELCSYNDLNEKEKYWLDYYGGKKSNNTYNVTEAGNGGVGNDEWRKKISNKIKQHYLNGDYDCRKKGTHCWVKKENKMQMIYVTQLENYIKRGWKRGRLPLSEEVKNKIRGRSGPLNHFYGHHHSESTKKKMRKKHNISPKIRKLMSQNSSKKFKVLKWINNGEINKRVKDPSIYLQQGWKLGRMPLPQISLSLKKYHKKINRI